MGVGGFLIGMGLLFGVGGLIYLYAKHIGKGDVKAAFEDAHDRKRIIIVGAAITGLVAVIFLILVLTGTLNF